MEDGGGDVAGRLRQLLLALQLQAGPELLGPVFRQRRHRHDVARDADGLGRHVAVLGGGEVVRPDLGMRLGVRRRDAHPAAAGRADVGDAGREGRERIERLAELGQRERLDVVLQVGRLAGSRPT